MKNSIKDPRKLDEWAQLLLILALLMPLLALFLLPGAGMLAGDFSFWLALLTWAILGSPAPAEVEKDALRMLAPEEQPAAIGDVMRARMEEEAGGGRVFRGRLRESAASAYEGWEPKHCLRTTLPKIVVALKSHPDAFYSENGIERCKQEASHAT